MLVCGHRNKKKVRNSQDCIQVTIQINHEWIISTNLNKEKNASQYVDWLFTRCYFKAVKVHNLKG